MATGNAAKPLVAIDADGVLLDYGSAYPHAPDADPACEIGVMRRGRPQAATAFIT